MFTSAFCGGFLPPPGHYLVSSEQSSPLTNSSHTEFFKPQIGLICLSSIPSPGGVGA